MIKKFFLTLLPVVSLYAQSDLERLAGFLEGSFSSRRQAEADSDFYDIRLHAVRIWRERSDGIWLYVEQAQASQLDAPYRQRIYKLAENDGLLTSEIFTFPEPSVFAGAYRQPALFDRLDPQTLQSREGCIVVIAALADGTFSGRTNDRDCRSNHRGAAYAAAEVLISATQMISWDRGFDQEGRQVWGSTKGGYVFDKIEEAQ